MPVAGAAIALGGSLIGGNQQANAAQDAGNAGAQGGRDAIAANVAFYNQNRQDNYGSMVTGNSALRQLAQLYGLDFYTGQPSWDGVQMSGGQTTTDRPSTLQRMLDPGGLWWSQTSSTTPLTFGTGGGGPGGTGSGSGGAPGSIQTGGGMPDNSSFYMSPDFLVRMQEGLRAGDRQAAARGGYRGGSHDIDTMRFSANLGAQGFNDYRGALMTMAGFGQQATGQVGNSGQTFGSNIGSAAQNMGNARASGYMNAGNARADAWNGVGSALGSMWGNQGWGG